MLHTVGERTVDTATLTTSKRHETQKCETLNATGQTSVPS